MNVTTASTEEIAAAVARKIGKFGSLEAMPPATRELVRVGQVELEKRAAQLLNTE